MTFQDYFQCYKNYFWEWESELDDRGTGTEIVVVAYRNSLAYRSQIAETLAHLAPQGIPPFGSLVLVLMALHDNGMNILAEVYKNFRLPISPSHSNHDFLQAHTFLRQLASLPDEYKKGQNQRLLLQTIFENCHKIVGKKDAFSIVGMMSGSHFYHTPFLTPIEFNEAVFSKETRVLALLSKRFPDNQTIIDKINDIPTINEPIEIPAEETPASSEEQPLLEQLLQNEDTFYAAALVKNLWAGLPLPIHKAMATMQPLGGISDLTNKGDFDKLLISEFANDDLVFLSRLANNEALYIHREIPPIPEKVERVILIDVSLKNWGTPKTLGFAVLLAMATHPQNQLPCLGFTVGDDYQPIELDSVAQITKSLQNVSSSLHAAKGLTKFLNEYQSDAKIELFLVSSSDTLKHQEIQKILNDYHERFTYVVAVEPSGKITMTQHRKKQLRHLELNLEDLWRKPPSQKTIPEKESNSNPLPSHYPLLFSLPANPKKLLISESGDVYVISSDKGVFKVINKDKHSKAGLLLWENLQAGNILYEIGEVSHKVFLLCFNVSTRELSIYNLTDKKVESINFLNWKSSYYQQFFFDTDSFMWMNIKEVWGISPYPKLEMKQAVAFKLYQGEIYNRWVNTYNNRVKELKEIQYYSYINILKNVNHVFINEKKELCLNAHVLKLYTTHHTSFAKWTVASSNDRKEIQVARREGSVFTFQNGNTVTVNKLGMFILYDKANDKFIYLNSILEEAIGMATENDFAGNETYCQNTKQDQISAKTFYNKHIEPFLLG